VTAAPATVLVVTPSAPAGSSESLARALGRLGPVLTPDWPLGPHDDVLGAPTGAALEALQAHGAPVVVCGLGAGAVVALQVAVAAPEQVLGLVLCTGARPLATVVRSVHRGVAGLLPLDALRRLGGRGSAVVPVLDPVRPQDYRRLAPQVRASVLVPYGDRDRVNRRPSRLLAGSLPHGSVVELRDAGPGWMWREPERLLEPVREVRGRR